jgi:hypothetical protein
MRPLNSGSVYHVYNFSISQIINSARFRLPQSLFKYLHKNRVYPLKRSPQKTQSQIETRNAEKESPSFGAERIITPSIHYHRLQSVNRNSDSRYPATLRPKSRERPWEDVDSISSECFKSGNVQSSMWSSGQKAPQWLRGPRGRS